MLLRASKRFIRLSCKVIQLDSMQSKVLVEVSKMQSMYKSCREVVNSSVGRAFETCPLVLQSKMITSECRHSLVNVELKSFTNCVFLDQNGFSFDAAHQFEQSLRLTAVGIFNWLSDE